MKMTLKIIPYIIFQIIVMTLLGLNELYQSDWDPARLADLGFWIDYATVTLATMISFYSWANIRIDYYLSGTYIPERYNESDVRDIIAKKRFVLNQLITTQMKPSIRYFVDEVNYEEKEKVFNYMVSNKLSKLYFRNNKTEAINNQISVLEEYQTIEWQSKNLKYYNIKYVSISESYIRNGYSTKTDKGFRKRSERRSEKIIKDNISRWMLSLSYLLFFTSMGFNLIDDITPAVILAIGIKVVNCIWQSINGARYAKVYAESKIIPELDDRQQLMEGYIKGKEVYDLQYEQHQLEKKKKLEKKGDVEDGNK